MTSRNISNLDLDQKQLLNAVFQNLSTAPLSPKIGQFYFDTTQNKLMIWDGSNWIGGKQVTSLNTSGTITLSDNTDYYISATGNITFTLPTITDTTVKHRIDIELYLPSAYSVNLGLGNSPNCYNKTLPDLSSAGTYNLLYEYSVSKSAWYCGGAEIGVAE